MWKRISNTVLYAHAYFECGIRESDDEIASGATDSNASSPVTLPPPGQKEQKDTKRKSVFQGCLPLLIFLVVASALFASEASFSRRRGHKTNPVESAADVKTESFQWSRVRWTSVRDSQEERESLF